jgi:hypothetical protein
MELSLYVFFNCFLLEFYIEYRIITKRSVSNHYTDFITGLELVEASALPPMAIPVSSSFSSTSSSVGVGTGTSSPIESNDPVDSRVAGGLVGGGGGAEAGGAAAKSSRSF